MTALLENLSEWDKKTTKKIAAKTPKQMGLASFFAISGNALPWFILSFLLFVFDLFMTRNVNLLQLFLAAACGLTTSTIKYITRRQRPDEVLAKSYAADIVRCNIKSSYIILQILREL